MKNIVCLLLFACLSGCGGEDVSELRDFDATRTELITLNTRFLKAGEGPWPFTEDYLKARHSIYEAANLNAFSAAQKQTLEYLIITERFPERFYPWPVQSQVISTVDLQAKSEQTGAWLAFIKDKLHEGAESKIILNNVELEALKQKLAKIETKPLSDKLSKAVKELSAYLADYTPRTMLGLHQVPNGRAWYQSKLNYYTKVVRSPDSWLVDVQSRIKNIKTQGIRYVQPEAMGEHLVEAQFKDIEPVPGLDWQQGFKDLRTMAKQVHLSPSDRLFWLAIMETDLGLNHQGWSEQQALLSLEARLDIGADLAQSLIREILFYPAQSFVFVSANTETAH